MVTAVGGVAAACDDAALPTTSFLSAAMEPLTEAQALLLMSAMNPALVLDSLALSHYLLNDLPQIHRKGEEPLFMFIVVAQVDVVLALHC